MSNYLVGCISRAGIVHSVKLQRSSFFLYHAGNFHHSSLLSTSNPVGEDVAEQLAKQPAEHSIEHPVESVESTAGTSRQKYYQGLDGRTGFSVLMGSDNSIIADDLQQNIQKMRYDNITSAGEASALALVTPRFVDLFRSSDDLARMIAQRALTDKLAVPRVKTLTLTVGAVDRISLPTKFKNVKLHALQDENSQYVWGTEGIAISNVPTSRGAPSANESTFQPGPGSLVLMDPIDAAPQSWESPTLTGMAYVSLSLAKMNMVSGEDFFLRRQQWRLSATKNTEKISEEEISEYRFFARRTRLVDNLRINGAKVVPIGSPRRISSSFGNVIRSLESGDKSSEPLAASAEMEKEVPRIKTEFSTLPEIWAFVQPAHSFFTNPRLPQSTMDMLHEGGRFFRVSGGGGGWDGPGGPVSLEVESREPTGDDLLMSELPDFSAWRVVKTGDVVTFLAVGLPAHKEAGEKSESDAVSPPKLWSSRYSLKFASGSPAQQWQEPLKIGRLIYEDYFGAVGERLAYGCEMLPSDTAQFSVSTRPGLINNTRLPSFAFLDTVSPARKVSKERSQRPVDDTQTPGEAEAKAAKWRPVASNYKRGGFREAIDREEAASQIHIARQPGDKRKWKTTKPTKPAATTDSPATTDTVAQTDTVLSPLIQKHIARTYHPKYNKPK